MRSLLIALLLLAAVEGTSYSWNGYSFSLPLEFKTSEQPAAQGYLLYYPSDEATDCDYKIVVDRLPASQAAAKNEYFSKAFLQYVGPAWTITGRTRTILGRTVTEAGGNVTLGDSRGKALAYSIPARNGDQLFVAVIGVREFTPAQLEQIATALTGTLKQN